MKKILAFGASNSSKSINKQLAQYTAAQLEGVSTTFIDLNDFEMPIYGIDKENASGVPQLAKDFHQLIKDHDGIIVSLAEHNGSYTVAFKNLIDWTSRLKGKLWDDKPLFVLSTSPGGRGGASVMESALKSWPFWGGKIAANFSMPFFNKNFSADQGILDEELKANYASQLSAFSQAIQEGQGVEA